MPAWKDWKERGIEQMHRRLNRSAAVILMAVGMLLQMPFEAMAAASPIKKVSVRVASDMETGSSLPDIEIGSGSVSTGKVRVSGGNSKYTVTAAEWLDKSSDKVVKASDEPKMKVTLEPTEVSEDYFLASYKASNVKISGGSFVSARRDGDDLIVTLRVKPVKGHYDAPKDAFWFEDNLGEARWEKPENTSGYYELKLNRDGKSVHTVDKVSALKYNFYPYMTKAGEYTFEVRTIPGTDTQNKYGKKSDWLESGELEITDRYVSDGKGQQKKDSTAAKGTKETVGWIKENNVWFYRHPDGELSRDTWESIDGYWYYFDVNGGMLTGWQNINGGIYYFHSGGQMAVGWTRIDQKWYFFRTEEEGNQPVGTMMGVPGWRVIGSHYFYFNDDGSIYIGWLEQDGKRYYLNELDNSLQGAMFVGWIERDEKVYFADSNGEIAEGWWEIEGSWYYFYPGTGEMARNTDIDGFHLDENGRWT